VSAEQSLAQPGELAFGVTSVAELGTQLAEWKEVHTTVQKLFLSLPMRRINRVARTPKEEDLYTLDNYWATQCEPVVRAIQRSFPTFRVITHQSIANLLTFLQQQQYPASWIRTARITEQSSLDAIRTSAETLQGLLEELLQVADQGIVAIARALREQ
jgi:hypothetical protein